MSGTTSDVVGITVGPNTLSGWQDVRITRSIERCPPSFDIALTERYPGASGQIDIQPGAPCQVTIGGEDVITGYVDRYTAGIGIDTHQVRISGRGMCEDLVDCSAMFSTYQLRNTTLYSLAAKLAQPFGITVTAPDGDSAVMPQFNVILTETPYEIIERVARWANFIAYEETDGSLTLARLGDTQMASGFVQGQNVQVGDVSFTRDQRFTEMHTTYLSTAFLVDPPPNVDSSAPVVNCVKGADATDSSFPARRDGNPRYRPLLIVSEQSQNSDAIAAARTQWDNARRIGRSQQIRLTCDSWRDSAGKLWNVNSLAVLNLPALKLVNQTWLISEVTFVRNESGTTAELTLMPPSAFVPSPDNLQPFDWQVAQDIPGGATNYGPAPR